MYIKGPVEYNQSSITYRKTYLFLALLPLPFPLFDQPGALVSLFVIIINNVLISPGDSQVEVF